jgi:hypothetical protein
MRSNTGLLQQAHYCRLGIAGGVVLKWRCCDQPSTHYAAGIFRALPNICGACQDQRDNQIKLVKASATIK